MATLIQTHGGDRCDARCYEAAGPHCDCVCGGRNHGKGLIKALEETSKSIEEIADEKVALHPRMSAFARVRMDKSHGPC